MGYIAVGEVLGIVFAAMTFVVLLVGLIVHIADRISKRK
jgi:Ca2+/Na+ antiporter